MIVREPRSDGRQLAQSDCQIEARSAEAGDADGLLYRVGKLRRGGLRLPCAEPQRLERLGDGVRDGLVQLGLGHRDRGDRVRRDIDGHCPSPSKLRAHACDERKRTRSAGLAA